MSDKLYRNIDGEELSRCISIHRQLPFTEKELDYINSILQLTEATFLCTPTTKVYSTSTWVLIITKLEDEWYLISGPKVDGYDRNGFLIDSYDGLKQFLQTHTYTPGSDIIYLT